MKKELISLNTKIESTSSSSGFAGTGSGNYFNWNTGRWETPGGNSCNSYASCFQQENKKSGGKK